MGGTIAQSPVTKGPLPGQRNLHPARLAPPSHPNTQPPTMTLGMKVGDRDTPGSRTYSERGFRESAQVLVATEAAGEGINLQFCWFMINYDILAASVKDGRDNQIHRRLSAVQAEQVPAINSQPSNIILSVKQPTVLLDLAVELKEDPVPYRIGKDL